MEEEKTQITQMPRKLWNGALKMVKGDNTTQLIEQFTAEMTLVAEGLCEDQSKLRAETDRLITEKDRQIQKLESRVDLLENALEEERAQRDRELTENRDRMAALERQAAQSEKKEKKSKDIWRRDVESARRGMQSKKVQKLLERRKAA